MRIAQVTATFPPYFGGTGQVCFHNALELARRGHDVTVFTAAYPPGRFDYPAELKVRRLPVAWRVGNAPLLPGLLGLRGFDVVHVHYPFFLGAEAAALAARRGGMPLVMTYHQDVLLPGLAGALAGLHARTLGAACLRAADKVLFTTLDYAQTSSARWLLRAAGKVGELPNGVDTQRFHPGVSGAAVRAALGAGPETAVLLLVAGLDRPHYFKGVSVLLAALARLGDLPLRLVVVGEGALRGAYAAEAERLGLGERVTFAGRVTDADLPGYDAAADVGVLPSTTRGEAFGLALLEAMACGKPVVASRLPGVRAVVADGVDGLLAEPGDAAELAGKLRQLAEQPALRERLGAAGRAKAAGYAWPRVAERLEGIYGEAGGGSQKSEVGSRKLEARS